MRQRLKLKFTQSDLKLFGGASILIVLICASIFLYTQWDLRRFKDSLENRSRALSPSVREKLGTTQTLAEEEKSGQPQALTDKKSPTETAASKPLASEKEKAGSEDTAVKTAPPASTKPQAGIGTSEVSHLEAETWDPLSEDIDWEKAIQDDEYLHEIDNRIGHASVINVIRSNTSANPADTAFVANMLRRSAEGTASIDDLIGMTEVWIRIESNPDEQTAAKTHQTLSALHTHLQSAKEQYARGEILGTRIYIGAPE